MTASPDPAPDRDEWLRRFNAIAAASLFTRYPAHVDWDTAARCLTEAFPPWRVWIGDQGGWYAGSPVPSPAGRPGGGETVWAAGPEQMRDLLTARCGS